MTRARVWPVRVEPTLNFSLVRYSLHRAAWTSTFRGIFTQRTRRRHPTNSSLQAVTVCLEVRVFSFI